MDKILCGVDGLRTFLFALPEVWAQALVVDVISPPTTPRSAKRQKAPLVLSPEEVKLGLAELQFRDQLLFFLIGALGTRRGEVGCLALDGLRLREGSLLHPALLLLEKRRAFESDQDGQTPQQ